MYCEEIYESALALLGESLIRDDNADYEERAPYILATFCSQAIDKHEALSNASGILVHWSFNPVCIPLNTVFPLNDRFASAATLYLASMLVIDSDEELSDKLYHRFCEAMVNIPSVLESIENKYF